MADTQAENPAAPAATTEHRLEGLLEHATRIFLTSRTETVEADIALVLKHFRHRLGAEQATLFLCPAAEGEDTPPHYSPIRSDNCYRLGRSWHVFLSSLWAPLPLSWRAFSV